MTKNPFLLTPAVSFLPLRVHYPLLSFKSLFIYSPDIYFAESPSEIDPGLSSSVLALVNTPDLHPPWHSDLWNQVLPREGSRHLQLHGHKCNHVFVPSVSNPALSQCFLIGSTSLQSLLDIWVSSLVTPTSSLLILIISPQNSLGLFLSMLSHCGPPPFLARIV